MRSNVLTTFLFALCAVHGVFAAPLDIQHAAGTTTVENDNAVRLAAAKDEANSQITKMETALNDPTNAKHKPLIDAAFGTDSSLDINKIKANVQKLKTGTIPVNLANAGDSKTMAYTEYDAQMKPQSVNFGSKYHKSALSTQAGTMIHEASHHLADTGDYIKDGKMLKGSHPDETDRMGYASKQSFYKSAKSLNGDKTWTNMRDGHTDSKGVTHAATKNMHDNAESYAQFASLCNAVVRRDLHMYRRALAAGDDEAASYYLAKRSSCALPKDYFAKKAAAKKATEAKAKGVDAKTAGSKLPTAKNAKNAASSKTPLTQTKGRAAKSSKLGSATRLANGRVAKPASKVAGSRRPTSKVAAGKRVTAKAASKVAGSRRPASRVAAGKRVTPKAASKVAGSRSKVAAGKRVTPKAASKVAGSRRPASKVAAGKRVTAKSASKVAGSRRPASKVAAGKRVTPKAASKVAGSRRPASKVAGGKRVAANKPASRVTRTAANKPANKLATKPAAAAKVTPTPVSSKKGRR